MKTNRTRLAAIAGLCFGLAAAPAVGRAADPASSGGTGAAAAGGAGGAAQKADVSKIDEKKFVTEAATHGMAEVELGKIAERRAQSPAVERFAQKMVTDHSAANQRLAKIAGDLGIQLPDRLDPKHQQLADRLTAVEADDFDEDYMKAMVDDHENDVAAFREAALTKEGPVASFAEQTLPTLEEHLALARQVNQQVSMGGPAGTIAEGESD